MSWPFLKCFATFSNTFLVVLITLYLKTKTRNFIHITDVLTFVKVYSGRKIVKNSNDLVLADIWSQLFVYLHKKIMGKGKRAEAGTPKWLANKMNSKGLQKLHWYCQMCQKQCWDQNGFKCHISFTFLQNHTNVNCFCLLKNQWWVQS